MTSHSDSTADNCTIPDNLSGHSVQNDETGCSEARTAANSAKSAADPESVMAVESNADSSPPGNSATDKPAGGEPVAGEPAGGEPVAGEPVAEEPAAGEIVEAQSAGDEAIAEETASIDTDSGDKESPDDHPASAGKRFIWLAGCLLLIIIAIAWYAQPGNRLQMAEIWSTSPVMTYLQAQDRSEIASYCQQIALAVDHISKSLDEIGALAASYDPDTSGDDWQRSMDNQMAAVRIETGRARLLSPPLVCASAHWTCMAGLDKIDQAMGELEKGLKDNDPVLIKNSYNLIGQGSILLNEALNDLAGINSPVDGGLEGSDNGVKEQK